MADRFSLGLDVGASAAKAVLLDGEVVRARSIQRSGADFAAAATACRDDIVAKAELNAEDIKHVVTTGYGRRSVPFATSAVTEITCHARGCYAGFPRAITIVDIGGQDNKVIVVEDGGDRRNFKMNRKCAAGTGAFLEEIAAAQGSRPKVLSEDAVNRLAQYHWPGNVSQLRQVCQALTLRNPEERVLRTRQVEAILPTMEQEVPLDHYSLEDLVYAKLSRFMERLRGYHVTGLHRDIMDRMERQLLLLALELSGGSQVEAAKLLGMNRTSLRRRLVRFELTGK